MQNFEGKLAVISGGGSGIGRALAEQLSEVGCNIGLCDLSVSAMEETSERCSRINPNISISIHVCDVTDEAAVLAFCDDLLKAHEATSVNLVFSNAGIGGSGSFIQDDREDWERTFNVCWYGVYYMARTFLPLLIAAEDGHLINTSSINGFWASLGPGATQTSYAAAKFAVKGFSEALITDLRLHAPHVKVSVVMPGHIGTNIHVNSGKILGKPDPMDLTTEDVTKIRNQMIKRGKPVSNLPDDAIRSVLKMRAESFRDLAPTSPSQAAKIILDGVRENKWRILVGEDAHVLDAKVRATPEDAYDAAFMQAIHDEGYLKFTLDR